MACESSSSSPAPAPEGRRCAVCDAPIVGRGKGAIYCSRACNARMFWTTQAHKRSDQRQAVAAIRACDVCGRALGEGYSGHHKRHAGCVAESERRRLRARRRELGVPTRTAGAVAVEVPKLSYLAQLVARHKPCRGCGFPIMPKPGRPLLCYECRGDDSTERAMSGST